MTAQDYTISFRYGATSSPYSQAYPHRGDDRACPYGTSLVVESTQIGLTGNTGYVLPVPTPQNPYAGSHLHIQEWQTYPSNTRKPQNSFKGGTVVHTNFSSDFGNYISIQKDGWNTSYCHLSRIDVKVGQVITGELTMTPEVAAALDDLKKWVVDTNQKVDYVQKQLNDLKNWELDTNKAVKEEKNDH